MLVKKDFCNYKEPDNNMVVSFNITRDNEFKDQSNSYLYFFL